MLIKPTIASRNLRYDPKTLNKGGGREELNKTMERLVKHVDLKYGRTKKSITIRRIMRRDITIRREP
jgi:hypothetical protein